MVITKKMFPNDLKDKILCNVKKCQVTIHFIDGAIIENKKTNIRFIQPFKVVFESKSTNPIKYLVAIIFNEDLGSKQTIFINSIGIANKCSISRLFKLVNDSIN